MDLLNRHMRALDEFGSRVHRVGAGQWGDSTPCTDWDVRNLVSHLVVEQLWVPYLLAGGTVEEAGDRFSGDQLGAYPASAWDRASAEAHAAFSAEGALKRTVHLSYGASPADAYCREMISDLVIHAWDLARAIGADERLDPELVSDVYEWTSPYAEQLQQSGLFAAPVPVPAGTDKQTKTLALFGRKAGHDE